MVGYFTIHRSSFTIHHSPLFRARSDQQPPSADLCVPGGEKLRSRDEMGLLDVGRDGLSLQSMGDEMIDPGGEPFRESLID